MIHKHSLIVQVQSFNFCFPTQEAKGCPINMAIGFHFHPLFGSPVFALSMEWPHKDQHVYSRERGMSAAGKTKWQFHVDRVRIQNNVL